MQRAFVSGAIVALAAKAMAGVVVVEEEEVAEFVNTKWDAVTVGDKWPIEWTKGNGNAVSLAVKDDSWEHVICDEEPAPGKLDWVVDVPQCGREYYLSLDQHECDAVDSPKFLVKCATGAVIPSPPAGNGTHSYPKKPKVVVVWYDEDCSCQKHKDTDKTWPDDKPKDKEWAWYDEDLKCSVTAQPPAPTGDADCGKPGKPACNAAPVAPAADADCGKPGKPACNAAPVAPAADADCGKPGKPACNAAPVAPAAATTAAPVAAATNTPVAPKAPEASKVAPAAYTGAAAKITGSVSALAVVLVAAMAL